MGAPLRAWRGAVVAAVGFAIASEAGAQIVNGGFEDGGGSYAGWSTVGDTLILNDTLGSGPTQGSWQSFMASATDGSVNSSVPAGSGVGASVVEALLGLNSGTLAAVGNGTPVLGSAIAQTLTVSAGDRITFAWNFLTNQTFNDGSSLSLPPSLENNDFSFFSAAPVGSPGSGVVTKLADTFYGYVNDPNAPGGFVTGFTITAPSNPFISETGFLTFDWTAPTSGSYIFGAGVFHATTGDDNGVNSALLADDFMLTPVPEPATCAIVAPALALMLKRRRRVT